MPDRRKLTRKERRQAAGGAALQLGGAAGYTGGLVARQLADHRSEGAEFKRSMGRIAYAGAKRDARDYVQVRRKEIDEARRTTPPAKQQVHPKVVGHGTALKVRTTPVFRNDLVPHSKESGRLGEQAWEGLQRSKEYGAKAERLARKSKNLKRGGAIAVGAGLGTAATGIAVTPRQAGGLRPEQKRVRKSADPFGVSKGMATWARGPVVQSRGSKLYRARQGGKLLRSKTRIELPNENGTKSVLVVGGGLTPAGKALVGTAAVGGVAAAGHAHGKVYRRRNGTETVKVKIKKGYEMSINPFGVDGIEIEKGLAGMARIAGGAKLAAQGSFRPAAKVAGSGFKQMGGQATARLKPIGQKFNGMSTTKKIGLGAAGAGALGAGGYGMSRIGKAHKPSKGDPSGARRLSAYAGGPVLHGAVAGRKGKKLRAVGYEYGRAALGGAPGLALMGAGLATKSPALVRSGMFGGAAGGAIGQQVGVTAANRKGYYKREKVKKSAFDVEHADSVAKAYVPTGGGAMKLKALARAAHGDALAGRFSARGKPELAGRAVAVRNSAMARATGTRPKPVVDVRKPVRRTVRQMTGR